MTDANGPPRRVSMAYILGFSNKPFKDGGPPFPPQPPAPRHPNAFKQMVSTPGGVIEWAASDGRRGRLTGPGKPRLTTDNVTAASEGKAAAGLNAGDDDAGMGMNDLFAEGSTKAASVKAAQNDNTADSSWTKEQDDKLMELKNVNKPWKEIVAELSKEEQDCKDRFKKIKPNDWRPPSGGGGKNNNGDGKKGKKDQDHQNNQKGGENAGIDKKNETANGGVDAAADNPWSGNNWPNNENGGATQNNNNGWSGDGWAGATGGTGHGGSTENKSENKDGGNGTWDGWNADTGNTDGNAGGVFEQSNDIWNNTGGDQAFNNDTTGWDTNNDGGGANNGVSAWGNPGDAAGGNVTGEWNNPSADDTNNANQAGNNTTAANGTNNNNNNNNNPWVGNNNTPNNDPPPKPPSHKPSDNPLPQPNSKYSARTSKPPPSEYELKPDSTFSADDLRLIARILQQDCQMVWNRVSWRFKDKTGRHLHADVFEKKVTGGIEGRGR